MVKILLVDDEPSLLMTLTAILQKQDYDVTALDKGADALTHIMSREFDLILTDIQMREVDGLQVLKHAQLHQPRTPVLMITAHGSVETAVDAMKIGAFDYVTKPFKVDELLLTVERALQHHKVVIENTQLKNKLAGADGFAGLVAVSENMREACRFAQQVAPIENPILLIGDKGVGKEALARFIHLQGERSQSHFAVVDCAKVTASEFSDLIPSAAPNKLSATGVEFQRCGTILLRDIESLDADLQSQLLLFLQGRATTSESRNSMDAHPPRIIATSSTDPHPLVTQGVFNAELFDKFAPLSTHIAPLKERRAEIMPLFFMFLNEESRGVKEVPPVEKTSKLTLEAYDWPRNADELKETAKNLIALNLTQINRSDLPEYIQAATAVTDDINVADDERGRSLKGFLRKKEAEYVQSVLDRMGGDKQAAAKALKISEESLNKKLGGSR